MLKLITIINLVLISTALKAETTTIKCNNVINPITSVTENITFINSIYDNFDPLPLTKSNRVSYAVDARMDNLNIPNYNESVDLKYSISFIPTSGAKNINVSSVNHQTNAKVSFNVSGKISFNFYNADATLSSGLPYGKEEKSRLAFEVLESLGLEDSYNNKFELQSNFDCSGVQTKGPHTSKEQG